MLDPTLVRPRFKPVGITKGPGENAHEYTFVSRDDEQVLKNGEYVYYELTEPANVGVPFAGTRPPDDAERENDAGSWPPGVAESETEVGTRPLGMTEAENIAG